MMRLLLFGWLLILAHAAIGQDRALDRIDSLINNGEFNEALTAINNAGTTSPSIRLENRRATVFIQLGKLNEAEQLLLRLVDTKAWMNDFQLAETKANLGFLYLNKARNDLALNRLQEALDLYRQAGQTNSPEYARCLSTLSFVYLASGKNSQAEENGLLALQIRQQLLGESNEEVAASYNDLGLVYGQSDPEKAIEYYEKGMAVYEQLHGKDHRKIAIASNNLGAAYRNLKLYGDAVTNFEVAEAIWKRIYPGGHPNLAFTLVNLGLTYDAMGNHPSAVGYFDRALAMYRKAYGDRHSDIAVVLNQLGLIRLDEGKYDEALNLYQEALIANSPTFNSTHAEANPKVTEFYNAKVMLYTLRLKADAFETKHLSKTLKLSDLTIALATLHSCDTLIDNIRHSSTNENDKLEIGASANDVYESGVRIAQALSEMTIKGNEYRELAFYFAEKSKSAVLQESIAEAEAKSFAGLPQDVLENETQLKANLALVTQKLAQKPDREQEAQLREQLFETNRQYNALVKRMETDFPDYFNLKFNKALPSIADVQHQLTPEQAVISYFVADKGSRLYSFVITQKRFRLFNSTLPADFDKQIKGFTNGIYFMAPDVYSIEAQTLSKLLLRGLPAVKEVIFIPAGRLGTVPFEALFYGRVSRNSGFSNYPYLVNSMAVRYEFSAGLLLQKSSKPPVQGKGIFLCAPISFPEKDNLGDLPGTRDEVNSIARLFGNDARVVLEADANETTVKSGNLASYSYLHFATHGIVDESAPELSRIYLQNSRDEDGNVFSGEIFNLKLNANLAVLSACQTGLGKYTRGEGVIGLSRALVYAGARSIVVSYWSVADESTARLMTEFYRMLLAKPGMSSGKALQEAKRLMIQDGAYAAPYFWAPFVLIGQ